MIVEGELAWKRREGLSGRANDAATGQADGEAREPLEGDLGGRKDIRRKERGGAERSTNATAIQYPA